MGRYIYNQINHHSYNILNLQINTFLLHVLLNLTQQTLAYSYQKIKNVSFCSYCLHLSNIDR